MIRIDDKTYGRDWLESAADRAMTTAGIDGRAHERYAVCFPDTADWLSLFFAIRAMNMSVLPLHPATPYPAARRLAEAAGCHRLFFHNHEGERLSDAAPLTGEGELLQMSSGTTGAPKCIARSWSDIDNEVTSYVATFKEPEGMTPVVACPTTHSYGLICGTLVGMARGATPMIVNTANPKYLARVLRETERPLLYSSPAILHTLARLLPAGERMYALMTSGTLLPQAWFAQIRDKTEHMFQQYGCSEAGCIAVNPDVTAAADLGFVLPHHDLSAGTSADTADEIVIRNAKGRINTRDLGYRRTDGMLVFIARLDDTINVSGLNVYPGEVEDVVMAKPGITDAVAFRQADRFAGERVGLIFSAEREVPSHEIRAWCSSNLAAHQVPMTLVQVDAVPRQANGKISRREIAERYDRGEFRRLTAEVTA